MQATSNFGTVKIMMLKGEQGEAGENGHFEDLTDEQKAELKTDLRAFYKKSEGVYTTLGLTTMIEIPIDGFRSTDILSVDVNGLDLIGGRDYTVNGSYITLAEPITESGAIVHFVALRAAAVSEGDYSAMKGDTGAPGASCGYYGTCSTEEAANIKTATCEGFTRAYGAILSILFDNAAGGSGSDIALEVNRDAIAPVYVNGVFAGSDAWEAGQTVTFMFTGNAWHIIGRSTDGMPSGGYGGQALFKTQSGTAWHEPVRADRFMLTVDSIAAGDTFTVDVPITVTDGYRALGVTSFHVSNPLCSVSSCFCALGDTVVRFCGHNSDTANAITNVVFLADLLSGYTAG